MIPTASPFLRIKSIINPSGWEVGSCAVFDTVWGGFPVPAGSCYVPARFPVGSVWVPRSPMQCKVGSRWAPGGFRCCAMWFGVLGWASRWGRLQVAAIPTKKKSGARATTLNESAELRRLRVLGGPKLAAPTVTHIERELGSYHLARPFW